MLTLTISQLNRYIKAVLEEDRKLSDLYIKGEISNFTHHFRSGHFYFTLKDESSSIKAVMFKSHAADVPFTPESGMTVLVRAGVGVYERDGAYQLYVTDMQPDGAGALALAFAQLKERLAGEGLFEARYKKPLPPYPSRVGVVTSETGAALRDITQVLSRRYPVATLVFCPALVQGREAEASLVRALARLDGACDVIILGRGGGSAEDLSCFNGEMLARAV
ncbi:MAG: exodeoxyribonuclease VII large subunit, partial [Oscillospiraceae bacterium]|nr:exodeoxyribonuclease VII large subunit [Oscillospiraceae bacterium]